MEKLIDQFIDRYLPRKDVAYRLPVSISIDEIWSELLVRRKSMAHELPLHDQNGNAFWFVLNRSIEKNADKIAGMARRDIVFDSLFETRQQDALIDEAVWSSAIEGAFTSKAEAAKMILKNKKPSNRSEQMVSNNYHALLFVLDHLEEPITKQMLVNIAMILTKDASEATVIDYREEPVYVTGREGIVYTPPAAESVPDMMNELITFINDYDIHPIFKACVAHFYLVYVHPFMDGNGRTARALTLMILLKSGYDFFRYFSISGIVSEERRRYYKSMLDVEDMRNGCGDMTYFIDCYISMLARTVKEMEDQLTHHVLAEAIKERMMHDERFNQRQIDGITWLYKSSYDHVTVEQWKKKLQIVTETARKDLLFLCEEGLLIRCMDGKKAIFNVIRNDAENLFLRDR